MLPAHSYIEYCQSFRSPFPHRSRHFRSWHKNYVSLDWYLSSRIVDNVECVEYIRFSRSEKEICTIGVVQNHEPIIVLLIQPLEDQLPGTVGPNVEEAASACSAI